jgi:hypothetical protein
MDDLATEIGQESLSGLPCLLCGDIARIVGDCELLKSCLAFLGKFVAANKSMAFCCSVRYLSNAFDASSPSLSSLSKSSCFGELVSVATPWRYLHTVRPRSNKIKRTVTKYYLRLKLLNVVRPCGLIQRLVW